MKPKTFNIILIIIIAVMVILGYACINASVSLKYETNVSNPCISAVDGTDLCMDLRMLKSCIGIVIIVCICLIAFRDKIVKK